MAQEFMQYMNVQDLWQRAWDQLIRAQHDKKHRFRTAVISTVTPDRKPRARNVVLRSVDAVNKSIRFYTDCRSAKMTDLADQPITNWLFWDSKSQLQITASGISHRLSAEVEASLFAQLPKHGRKSYATKDAPGTYLAEIGDGLPLNWESISLAATDFAAANFCVIETSIDTVEILYLARAGHRRLKAMRQIDHTWRLEWIVP